MKLLTPADKDWPKLFKPSQLVTNTATQVVPHLRGMYRVLAELELAGTHAAGLAAPQVGVFYHFFLARNLADQFEVFINPTYLANIRPFGVVSSDYLGHYNVDAGEITPTATAEEGCLSFPGRRTLVIRAVTIMAQWAAVSQDSNCGYPCPHNGSIMSDLEARVFQHEYDHLEGHCIFPQYQVMEDNYTYAKQKFHPQFTAATFGGHG